MMKKRWLLLATLILIVTILPTTSAYALLQNVAELGPMPDAATRVSMLEDGQDVDEPAVYFVIFDDAPLASYRGGIPGLAATNSRALGQVKLDPDSVASIAYLNYLTTEHAAFETTMNNTLGRTVEVVGRFQYAINAIAIYATQSEADTIAGLTAVNHVMREQLRQLQTDAGPEWIGAPGLWDGTNTGGLAGTKGEGLIAGIIDSGVNSDHPSFAEVGPVDAYTHLNPYDDANPLTNDYVGACAVVGTTVVCNDKLIGMYDCMSGTGIGIGCPQTLLSGNEVDALLSAPTTSFTRRISGVAPHANLITYKACLPTGNCVSLNTVSAIEQATIDLVDVINYSIGGSSSDPWSDADALAYLGARDAGIFVATSAGNDGPGAATIGSPADAPWILSVAASTHNRTYSNGLINMSGGDTTPPPDINGRSITTDTISAPIVYAGEGVFGNALCAEGTAEVPVNPFPPGYFAGQIVVCDRGTFARTVKGDHVLAAGAIGMILANDEASGESLNADPHSLPAVHISYADGVILKNWLKDGGTGHTGKIAGSVLDLASSNGDVIASFSSRGQNPANSNFIKPDVAAPGVDVYAAVHSPLGSTTDEYSFLSGTSMASPHAAGAGVLLRALQPTWTPAELQSALMTTSRSSMVKEDTVTPADPFDMGAGRVDLTVAAKAGFVMDEQEPDYTDANPSTGGDPTTLNIPSLANNFCIGSCSWTRVLSSTQSSSVTWTPSYSGDPLLSISVAESFAAGSFTLDAGSAKSIDITATIDPAALPDQWVFGTLILTPDDGSIPTAHMPIAVVPRTAASHAATGWSVIKFPTPQPVCTGVGLVGPIIYDNLDCGFGYVGVTNTADGDVVKFDFIHAKSGVVYESGQVGTWRAEDSAWEFDIQPGNTTNPPTWPPGEYYIRVAEVNGYQDNFGQFSIFINRLGANITAPIGGTNYSPGDAINVTGVINKLDQAAADTTIEIPTIGVTGANYFLRLVEPDGTAIYTSTQQTASNLDGTFSFTIPAGTTSGVNPGVDEGFSRNLAIQLFDVTWNDGLHDWASAGNAGATNVNIVVEPTGGDEGSVSVQTSFVSSVGWVKPDETYPFSVIVRNFSADPITNVAVEIADVDGSNYSNILTPPAGTSANIISASDATTVTWTIPTMAANSSLTLVVQARADNLIEDATIVWKDISSTASMTYTGADLGDPNLVSTAHGPKVIPINGAYNSSRYGDRPFPVVQVDWFDRKHQPENTGSLLSDKINSPNIIGSTFNLFQENSFGQLYPNGTHPSSDIAQAGFNVDWNGYYDTAGDGSPGSGDDQFFFTTLDPQGTCTGVSNSALAGTGIYADRIVDGRYQMPGTTGYYGQDKYGSAIPAAVAGVGALMAVDDACGPTGKAVYDAAHIADPEIDYNDYDTDKDGIVDFFMMVFVGCGGNGASQLGPAGCDIGRGEPYDNIGPHRSSRRY